jgi:drug/metabolite transporter (DMT)-like permease
MTAPQQPARLSDPQTLAKAASAYAGLVFGIYWIPLRALELAGFPGIWAGVALNLLPCLLVLPAIVLRARRLAAQDWHFHCGTLLLGLAYALYASAFLFTQVINVIVLYYLLPLWGFLLARLFTGERITLVRWLSMALGFLGILVILGPEQGIPLPKAAGDWMALASGFLWAAGSLLLLIDEQSTAFDCGIAFIFWGTVCAAAMAIVAMGTGGLPPSILSIDPVLLSWLVPVALLIVVPAGFATVYGPMVLNPGVVGLLFMTEISVGTITAAVLTDEPFGIAQVLGIAFVSTAGLLEIVWHFTRNRPTALRQG